MRVKPPTHNPEHGPFLVFPGGDCVPLDGPLRVEHLRDGWYVIGRNSTVACGSERAAHNTLEHLRRNQDPNDLAEEILADLETEITDR